MAQNNHAKRSSSISTCGASMESSQKRLSPSPEHHPKSNSRFKDNPANDSSVQEKRFKSKPSKLSNDPNLVDNYANRDTIKSVFLNKRKHTIISIKDYLKNANSAVNKRNGSLSKAKIQATIRAQENRQILNNSPSRMIPVSPMYRRNDQAKSREAPCSFWEEGSKKFGYDLKSIETKNQSYARGDSDLMNFLTVLIPKNRNLGMRERPSNSFNSQIAPEKNLDSLEEIIKNRSRNSVLPKLKTAISKSKGKEKENGAHKSKLSQPPLFNPSKSFSNEDNRIVTPNSKKELTEHHSKNIHSDIKLFNTTETLKKEKDSSNISTNVDELLSEYYGIRERTISDVDVVKRQRASSVLKSRRTSQFKKSKGNNKDPSFSYKENKILHVAGKSNIEEYYDYVHQILNKGRDTFYTEKYASYQRRHLSPQNIQNSSQSQLVQSPKPTRKFSHVHTRRRAASHLRNPSNETKVQRTSDILPPLKIHLKPTSENL